ncbi:MAG: NAD(P)-dependent glycerol-3-phosphate dehydrogenase [Phycisphaerae bacterium]|nr:NAD(P)-dependent glycerol-3-phosphate dehydrogenase [Phycisphaerae bacterium]
MFEKITIIGDGAMGSVCAMMLCEKGLDVTLWGHDAGQLAEMEARRENVKFLPGYALPASLRFDCDDGKAMRGAQLLVSAVPCQFMRRVWGRLKEYVPDGVPIVSVAKGIEHGTLLRPCEILAAVVGVERGYAALSGPTIADELAQGMPATAIAASADEDLAREIQVTFNAPTFRVYTNSDIVGVELCGALKNVIAIAAGIIDGMGLGDNAKAALLARGLAEIQRLGLAMGAHEQTFAGLSGLGDLVTTCISPKGRNRSFGERIGRGMGAAEAAAATRSVVEGAATCQGVIALAERHRVEMPISSAIGEILSGRKNVQEAIENLMSRQLKAE